jgi:hypothetical protein
VGVRGVEWHAGRENRYEGPRAAGEGAPTGGAPPGRPPSERAPPPGAELDRASNPSSQEEQDAYEGEKNESR